MSYPVRLMIVVLLAAAVQASSAGAASITWAKKGEFETCLESSLDKWLAARAELEVNEDPAAAQLDNAAVATWTLETLAQCRARGGTAEVRPFSVRRSAAAEPMYWPKTLSAGPPEPVPSEQSENSSAGAFGAQRCQRATTSRTSLQS